MIAKINIEIYVITPKIQKLSKCYFPYRCRLKPCNNLCHISWKSNKEERRKIRVREDHLSINPLSFKLCHLYLGFETRCR